MDHMNWSMQISLARESNSKTKKIAIELKNEEQEETYYFDIETEQVWNKVIMNCLKKFTKKMNLDTNHP